MPLRPTAEQEAHGNADEKGHGGETGPARWGSGGSGGSVGTRELLGEAPDGRCLRAPSPVTGMARGPQEPQSCPGVSEGLSEVRGPALERQPVAS